MWPIVPKHDGTHKFVAVIGAGLALLLTAWSPAIAGAQQIVGKITFDWDQSTPLAYDEEYYFRDGTAFVPFIYVCAYDQDAEQDYEATLAGDAISDEDDLIGCDRADSLGNYAIRVHNIAQDDIYLVTRLCDNEDAGTPSPAEVCIRKHTYDDYTWPIEIWSKTYWNRQARFVAKPRQRLGWNLSCPTSGTWGRYGVDCSYSSWSGRPVDNTNDSNVHTSIPMFVAAMQLWVQNPGLTLKPDASNTFAAPNGQGVDTTDDYQDEVRIAINTTISSAGWAASPDTVWIRDEEIEKFMPTRITHELGHIAIRRWLQSGKGAGTSGDETNEGFSHFFAATAFIDRDSNGGFRIHSSMEANGTSSRDRHIDEARFFWDLYDNPASDDDSLSVSLMRLIKVWSRFESSSHTSTSGTANECVGASSPDDNCKNTRDYHHVWLCTGYAGYWDVWSTLRLHGLVGGSNAHEWNVPSISCP